MNSQKDQDDTRDYSVVYRLTSIASTRARSEIEAHLKLNEMFFGVITGQIPDGTLAGEGPRVNELLDSHGIEFDMIGIDGPTLIGMSKAEASELIMKWQEDDERCRDLDEIDISSLILAKDPERSAKKQREIERLTAEQVESLRLIAEGRRPPITVALQLLIGHYSNENSDDTYSLTAGGRMALDWWNKREE
jgi:hypothetical protein